jgi:hypothetical protein
MASRLWECNRFTEEHDKDRCSSSAEESEEVEEEEEEKEQSLVIDIGMFNVKVSNQNSSVVFMGVVLLWVWFCRLALLVMRLRKQFSQRWWGDQDIRCCMGRGWERVGGGRGCTLGVSQGV